MHSYSSKKVERTFLVDYQPPAYLISKIELEFQLDPKNTRVSSKLTVKRNPAGDDENFFLNGKKLKLESIELDGRELTQDDYSLTKSGLILPDPPDEFELRIVNRINPSQNKELSGLYMSSGMFCTQCEAEGFRAITYFPDRPDILSKYSVYIEAPRPEYPVLLSNGELVEEGLLPDNRHYARWVDPHPKPSYLFALVAGDLAVLEDKFFTESGRNVDLQIYTPSDHIDKCHHAMDCLKRAMRWDEEIYGCEYDMNRFMIVAVDDFNMGAMENKGLNIFNSKLVYAKPDTATDRDFHLVERVIAHEYFHNWSGNRVTVRDWFQLSLKEGFTIFREQQFCTDMGSTAVQRVHDVEYVKLHQFRQDAGPESHAVQPDSYLTIDNFYTLTVYNKGAELIRMLHQMIGEQAYRAATDLYFSRHDGSAATVEDFVACMEEASGRNLQQFRLWYHVAGTPRVSVERSYDSDKQSYTLHFEQKPPASSDGKDFKPMHIPVKIALFDQDGEHLPMSLESDRGESVDEMLFELRDGKQSVTFQNMGSKPVPSLLREFSAPIVLEDPAASDELHFIMANDDDAYNQWNSSQQVSKNQINDLISSIQKREPPIFDDRFLSSFESVLNKATSDPQFNARLLETPSEIAIAQTMKVVDPVAVHDARVMLTRKVADTFRETLLKLYEQLQGDSGLSADAVGKRALRNLCLSYLIEMNDSEVHDLAFKQFTTAENMTDLSAALTALVNSDSPKREEALDSFYEKWRDDRGVIDTWFRIQAIAPRVDTYNKVIDLTRHTAFNIFTPNRVYALIGGFCGANPYCFHAKDGSGYDLLAEFILKIDPENPQAAAHLMSPFSEVRRYDERRQRAMRHRLETIASTKSLSINVYETVDRILDSFEE